MRKKSIFTVIVLFSVMLMVFFSCTSLDIESGTILDGEPESSTVVPPEPDSASSSLPLEYHDTLDDPVFAALPPEVKTYLQTLSSAFKNNDEDFLLAQGEAMFEETVRPFYDDDEYFTMLYRVGGDAWDAPVPAASQEIAVSDIHHIEYTGWENGDPVMEIRGRLFYQDTQFIPCKIMLDWKLDEPKIIGLYP